jgi:hypothetical protein
VRRLLHELRHHAVDADSGEDEREDREGGQQHPRQPLLRQRVVDDLLHRLAAVERHVGVAGVDRALDLLGHRRGADGGPHRPPGAVRRGRHYLVGNLAQRDVDLRADLLEVVALEAPVPYVADDADHLVVGVDEIHVNPLADRILVGEACARQLFVDHHDVWRLLRVGVRDEAPLSPCGA